MDKNLKLAIIDYGSGNLKSVYNAFVNLNTFNEVFICQDKVELDEASHIVLPGVGAFADCMTGLYQKEGLIAEIKHQVLTVKKPFLGICVGMQVMADFGYENETSQGLGLIPGQVELITKATDFDQNKYKIPQIGWNNLEKTSDHQILTDVQEGDDVYFANSYRFIVKNDNNVIAKVDYGCRISAIIAQDNLLGIQFHPEKSGEVGLRILKNFVNL